MDTITTIIADPSRARRSSYMRSVRPEDDILVVGEASSTYEVFKALRHKPHVLVLDFSMAAIDGVSLLPLVRHQSPGTRVILVAERLHRARMMAAASEGARGFLPHAVVKPLLGKAVRAVRQGEAWVPRALTAPVIDAVLRHALK